MDEAAWLVGTVCECEREQEFCPRCKPRPPGQPATVLVTGGGSAFHVDENCEWLHRGQRGVERRGGTTAPIERVSWDTAQGKYQPCQSCCPQR